MTERGLKRAIPQLILQPYALPARRWLVQVHLWSALIAGAIISALGLSGSVILFRGEIYRAANADLMRVVPKAEGASLADQAKRVLQANPEAQIAFVALPKDSRSTTRFSLELKAGQEARGKEVYVNPYTAQILGSNARNVRWLDWIADLHTNFFARRLGREAHSYVAVFFLTLCVTGLVLWWPGEKHWKRSLTPNTYLRSWKRAFDLHKVTGIWAVLFLSMFALSAISLSWDTRKLVDWVTRSGPQKKKLLPQPSWSPGQPLLPLDAYVSAAEAAFPGGQPLFVGLPVRRNNLVIVDLRLPTDFRSEAALNSAFLDPATGSVLCVDRFQAAPLGQRVLTGLSALHFGEFGFAGDLPTRILWSVLGLTPSFLFGTGWLRWRKRLRTGSSRDQWQAGGTPNTRPLEREYMV